MSHILCNINIITYIKFDNFFGLKILYRHRSSLSGNIETRGDCFHSTLGCSVVHFLGLIDMRRFVSALPSFPNASIYQKQKIHAA